MREVLYVMMITAASCAMIGVFLVLRDLAMTADAISHSVLFGIVTAYMVTPELDSPLLFVGAVIVGVLTVACVELLVKTGNLREDAALGVVFPIFFSAGVILLSRYLRGAHLCVDSILMGEVIMTPLRRTEFLGIDMPVALARGWKMLVGNLLFIGVFYKELKISTFDPAFSTLSGISAVLMQYLITALVSVNAVLAFDAVGSILVISFLVAPAATAVLISRDLRITMVLSVLIACGNAAIGYALGVYWDVNIAGISAWIGMMSYLLVLFLRKGSPIRQKLHRGEQMRELHRTLMLIHIHHHDGEDDADIELGRDSMREHLRMKAADYDAALSALRADGLVEGDRVYRLTEKGEAVYETLRRENGI